MREFLEKNYTDEAIETDDLTIKLVIKALLEVRLHLKSAWAGQDGQQGSGWLCAGGAGTGRVPGLLRCPVSSLVRLGRVRPGGWPGSALR